MSIEWTEVEHTLGKAKSDVLIIFDCCHAGLLCSPMYRGPRRSFYYVAACKWNQVAHSSGEKSFTTAMIWALKELVDSPGFTVTRLVSTLMKHGPFPRDQQEATVFPSRYGPGTQDIWITPTVQTISPAQARQSRSKHDEVMPTANILDLRLHFQKHAPPKHIEETARVLKGLLETKNFLHFHRITFLDYTSLVEWTARRWLDNHRKGQSAKDTTASTGQRSASPSSEAFDSSSNGHLSQPPKLRRSNNTSCSAVSTTANTPPAARARETDDSGGKSKVSSGQLLVYPSVSSSVLFGCAALFGICCGSMVGLTWAFGDPRSYHLGVFLF